MPDVLFVIDVNRESLAIEEAKKSGSVGEKQNGYLAVIRDDTGAAQKLVTEVNKAFTITTRSGGAIIRTPVPPFKWWRGLQARKNLEDYFTARVAERRDAEGTDMLTVLCHTTDDDDLPGFTHLFSR